MIPFQHMESALPTIMGRAYDASTDKVRTLAFDPILECRKNTVEHPVSDGGGSNNLTTYRWFDGLGWIMDALISLCMMERCIGKRVVGMDDDCLTFSIPLFILKYLTVT